MSPPLLPIEMSWMDDLATLILCAPFFREAALPTDTSQENAAALCLGVRQREDVVAATEKLYRMLRNTYKTETGRIPLSMHAVIRKDSPIVLTARDGDGHTAYAEGAVPETAQNRPATEESIVRVLSKLGGTVFVPGQITAEVEDGLMAPVSEINACRRSICGQITKQRETPVQIPVLHAVPPIPEDRGASDTAPVVYARFERFAQLSGEALSLAGMLFASA